MAVVERFGSRVVTLSGGRVIEDEARS
jgi:hypothetical protein